MRGTPAPSLNAQAGAVILGRMMQNSARRRPRQVPVHPGEILREDVLPAMGISVSAAARDLRVSPQMLHKILDGTTGITPEMAVRLGKFCGNGPTLWLRMQQAWDLWEAERRLAGEVRRIPIRRRTRRVVIVHPK